MTAALTSDPTQTRSTGPAPPAAHQIRVIYSNTADVVLADKDGEQHLHEGCYIYLGTNGHRVTRGQLVLREKEFTGAEPTITRIPQVGSSITFADGETWIVNRSMKSGRCSSCGGA